METNMIGNIVTIPTSLKGTCLEGYSVGFVAHCQNDCIKVFHITYDINNNDECKLRVLGSYFNPCKITQCHILINSQTIAVGSIDGYLRIYSYIKYKPQKYILQKHVYIYIYY